jgi:hypothetical protein
VFNGQGIPSPFLIQLCDAWGNPSPDKRVVVALTSSSPSLEVRSKVTRHQSIIINIILFILQPSPQTTTDD